MRELAPPPTALAYDDPDEVLRIWVAGGESHVVFNFGVFGDDELRIWGRLLADATGHIVQAATLKGASAESAFSAIETGFLERLRANPTLTGSFWPEGFRDR
jgi:hypothetical protein